MIGIYDGGLKRIQDTFIQAVTKPEPKVCAELSELKDYKFAIVHVSPEEWEDLITEYSDSNYVRIRVTTDGTPSNKPPTLDKNGVYIFHLVMQTDDLTAEDWENILHGLSNQEIVENLVKGENPKGLRRFFELEVQEHISALLLLCEGYLAVHAENKGCHTDIHDALQLMKWSNFRDSERGKTLIRENLGDKKDEVQHPMWWLRVFDLWDSDAESVIQNGEKQESFRTDVEQQWKATGGKEIPDELNQLLHNLLVGETLDKPQIIADAYCVLRKKKL